MKRSEETSLEILYYAETQKRMQTVSESLRTYKSHGTGLDRIKTSLHTLKGSSNMMGLTELAQDFHLLEELFHTVSSPQDSRLVDAEKLLLAVSEKIESSTQESESVLEDRVLPNESALSVFQKLLGSVARLELLTNHARSVLEHDLSSEVGQLRELAFRSIFTPSIHLFSGLLELTEVVGKAERKQVKLLCRSGTDHILREYLVELRGTLVHLVNNCVTHGLEYPEERKKSGKDPVGRVEINLFQEGEYLCLEVQDDGRGVDFTRLQEVYESEDGRADWNSLSREEQTKLLFEQGRTLKAEADLHSGRGLGLSAVRESVQRLNGKVFFKSPNRGACLRIEIPSPFFLSRCLLVRSHERMFAVLANSVARVTFRERSDTPFPELSSSFGYHSPSSDSPHDYLLWPPGPSPTQDSLDAFSVTECLGLRELLVYALPKLHGLSLSAVGSAESSGEQCFVIDLEELKPNAHLTRTEHRASDDITLSKRILVVDDSMTTRSILVDVLHRAGYQVEEAVDGHEGRLALEARPFDLVVSDLEMPNCDGLEFLQWIRSESSNDPQLPFLLFTSRDDIESFEKAHLLGADRCLSKGHFQERDFLKLLEQLL